ncbi:MAG: peptidoglycan-binding protein [Rhodospirillaceae bacterium]|nr:peptidoglycan-binding protein [Rhodospirillales bacterium]
MSWFNLKQTMGTNYTVDPGDIINTKKALNQIGYYDVPPHRGIDDWTDDAMFNGIRSFQKDKGLKVDGLMRPGGPTETAINNQMTDNTSNGDENGPFQTGPIFIPPLPPRPPIVMPPPYDVTQPRPPFQPRPTQQPPKVSYPPKGGIRG